MVTEAFSSPFTGRSPVSRSSTMSGAAGAAAWSPATACWAVPPCWAARSVLPPFSSIWTLAKR